MSTHLVLDGLTAVVVTEQHRHRNWWGGGSGGGLATCFFPTVDDLIKH